MLLYKGFIFELTDLYEKKNLPKVIYCIHALRCCIISNCRASSLKFISHLLARRGLAEKIGNLLGRLHFSDDQLQRTQKGLKDAGVVMPNFGNVGKELAKEINEEPEVEVETEEERECIDAYCLRVLLILNKVVIACCWRAKIQSCSLSHLPVVI